MAGIQGRGLGPRNGVPATRASRGAPRGDERERVSCEQTETLAPCSRSGLLPAQFLLGVKWLDSRGRSADEALRRAVREPAGGRRPEKRQWGKRERRTRARSPGRAVGGLRSPTR